MKFARDCRSSESNEVTAQLLFEALPWIKNLTGKTVVIKYGGAAMVDEQLRRDVMSDIVLLKIIGMRPVIVHGGGKAINEALSHYDIPVEFKNGQRVTTPATMDIVREVLGGKVNQELVAALNHHGNLAVGVSGSDAGTLIAEPLDPELGRVRTSTPTISSVCSTASTSPLSLPSRRGRTAVSSTSTPTPPPAPLRRRFMRTRRSS